MLRIQVISKEKLDMFYCGSGTKTGLERQKEEQEMRRKKNEDSLVYADFVASFQDPHVNGQTLLPSKYDESEKAVLKQEQSEKAVLKQGQSEKAVLKQEQSEKAVLRQEATVNPLKRRHIEELASNLKRKAQMCEDLKRESKESAIISRSTNIFIGNLHPKVDEKLLCQEFSQFGQIASVKIMWARAGEDNRRQSGFVSFMDRESAQRAMDRMQNKVLLGQAIKLDWGKPVPLPNRPIQTFKAFQDAISAEELDRAVYVKIPQDKNVRETIDSAIHTILKNDLSVETAMKSTNNPQYQFLIDINHPHHHYYQWRKHSLQNGETITFWSQEPVRIASNGVVYVPPAMEVDCSNATIPLSDDDLSALSSSRMIASAVLSRLRALLNVIDDRRLSIARAMALMLDFAEGAAEMSAIVEEAMLNSKEQQLQMSILYLVHDVLSNCTAPVPNAWRYRDCFQKRMPAILKQMADTCAIVRIKAGKWQAESWKNEILAILGAWRRVMLYPRDFLDEMESIFKASDAEYQ